MITHGGRPGCSNQGGALIPSVAVSLSVDGIWIHSHYSHKIRVHIQGKKHQKLLQEKHEWSDAMWKSLDLNSLKIAFLTLDPVKHISCSKRIHGWINTGEQNPRFHLMPPKRIDALIAHYPWRIRSTYSHVSM